ncbi:MAG: hypothetical protein WCG91_01075 [Candidatus Shapirobacteria bacterium]
MKVTREFLNNWLDGLKKVWLEKDLDALKNYFGKIEKYYESPFLEPGKNINDVLGFWEEIKNEQIQELMFKIEAIEDNIGVVNWNLVDQNGSFDGIYLIKFDQDLNCVEFKQWCSEK